MQLRSLLAAAAFAAAFPAFATPQSRDLTDMWFIPAESGWGLNVIHQGDTLFATLFVFGPDGQPKWYVASSLSGGASGYSGALQECTGPWFGGTFDPTRVSCRTAGNMTFNPIGAIAALDYTVDGVHVSKQVSRFSFKATSLGGNYVGFMLQPATSSSAEVLREQNFNISDDGSSVTMATQSNSQSSCTWTGNHGQDGQYENVAGTYTCGTRSGDWSMRVDPTSDGFTGSFSGDGLQGRIGAATRMRSVNRGAGYRSDMWFVPGESGWGVNMIEQGDSVNFSIFATVFVYDPQGRPRWYVASDLARSDIAGDQVSYLGTLYEVTGPYFGTDFNPNMVTRRPVGFMSFTTFGSGGAGLQFTVDGVSVTRSTGVNRFAFRRQNFSGTYWGHRAADPDDPGGMSYEALTVSIDDNGGNFVMQTTTASGGICNYVAPVSQDGRLRSMNGTYSCTNGRSGPFTMSNAEVSADGFTAKFVGNGIVSGHMEGVRR